MKELLDQVLAQLERLGRTTLVERLRPGIAPEVVERELAGVELDAVAEVVDLYDWRGGTLAAPGTPLDDIHFFPGFYLLELEDAIRDYVGFRDDPRWRPDWLPVFANGGGDFYVADLASARSGAAPMIGFMVGGPEHLVEYESLRGMIATIAECYEKGAYFVDDRGYLEVDDQLHATIARRHNPSVELWSGAS